MVEELRKFTVEDLAGFNGVNGTPIYIAYEGRVFDVTASRLWRGGTHMKRHPAGRDLTVEMSAAPHDLSVLERFPQVGVLVPQGQEVAPNGRFRALPSAEARSASAAEGGSPLPRFLEEILERHPFFRRHPHPMTVHFPIVLMIFTPVFTLLYLATGWAGFETTAVNCLAAGLLFCLVVIPTGLFTWWVNYEARPMRPVTVKIVLSACMFADGLAAFLWRLGDPGVVARTGPSIPYLVLVFLLLPMVVVVAWFGATLTFPLRRANTPGLRT